MWDAVVVGLGGMGSATLCELARRGLRVLGVDRHQPPHAHGSSHGRSRIIRLAYMEDPAYVPLLRRAYEAWGTLQSSVPETLLTITGGLMIGPSDSVAVAGSLRSAREHDLPHRLLDARQIRAQFPCFTPDDDLVALYEEIAGVLDPEACVQAHLDAAVSAGAHVKFGNLVHGWEPGDGSVEVRLDDQTVRTAQLILTPGPWAASVLEPFPVPLVPARQVMHWFEPIGDRSLFMPEQFPIWLWEPREGDVAYGFPDMDGAVGGVKAAIHHGGVDTTPESVDRAVRQDDIEQMRGWLSERVPALAGRWLEGAVCLYTNTPDHHFVIDAHPVSARVHVAVGLSGHGFKFAPAVGEILADLAMAGGTELPIAPFAVNRFDTG